MNSTEILDQIDGVLDDWEVGPDAMRCNAPADAVERRERPGAAAFARVGAGFATVVITVDVTRYVAAMAQVAESVARTMALPRGQVLRTLEELAAAFAKPADVHHPPPLAIDGHAYRRRTRNRRKRR